MNFKPIVIITLFFLLLFSVYAAEDNHTLVFFYSDTCPHCHKESLFLDNLDVKYPELTIERYEVGEKENVQKLQEMANELGFKVRGVPVTVINEEYFIGYDKDSTTGKKIEEAVKRCLSDALYCNETNINQVSLPFFGQVDASTISLPIFTVIVGGLDGFNPCAMWVLTFLLSILIYAKSRKKMLIIGGVFVLASGLIYFLFMTAWLNFFLLVGYVPIMRIIIAIIAITAGLINIKELFWFKKGVSLTIDDKHKPKLFKKMRSIVHEKELPIAILGTITLAIFVNFIELLCTAGLPAIYTSILTANNLSFMSYYSYLALYNLIYVVPLIVIVSIFVATMGKRKFTAKQGKVLKLVSGLLMLLLGLIMLIRPELLNFG